MDLTTAIISLLIGIATFLIGMNMMSDGLKKSSGKGVKNLFKHTENNRFIGMGIGAAATALIQSSAATSIMVIGFISASVMTLFQGICVILGAYIGTTVTGIIVSFSSFPISKYFVLLAVVGVVMMFFKKELVKNIGSILAGLGLLFFGLSTMNGAFADGPLKDGLKNLCTNTEVLPANPLIFLFIGAIFTAIVQSSSATSGIVIVMVGQGAISFTSGMYLVLGATVGTVITTLIASIGGNANVKRTALACLSIRIVTAFIALAIVWPLSTYISNFFQNSFGTVELGLALFLVLYNVIFMLMVLPFVKPICNLFTKLIKDKDEEKKKHAVKFINEHLLNTPSVAMMQVKNEILEMLNQSYINFKLGYGEIRDITFDHSKEIEEREENIDFVNNAISEFLISLSNKVNLTDERMIGSYFHMINDIERIGDHAYNFHEQAEGMKENELMFSDTAKNEFNEMYEVINKMFDMVIDDFKTQDFSNLKDLHELENKTDKLKNNLSASHFERITKQQCHMELSPYYSTLLSELERVADHLVNIGYAFVNPTGDDEEKNQQFVD